MTKTIAPSKPQPNFSARDAELKQTPTTPEVETLLANIARMLEEGDATRALGTILNSKLRNPWILNAAGVCHLRLDNAEPAMQMFRGLVISPSGILLRSDVPMVFKVNFAAALLATDNVKGCLGVLREIGDDAHPTAPKLYAAIQRWKSGFSTLQKVNWFFGGVPDGPVPVDFPLGDLQ